MQKIKYGVLGLGWFGQKHCEALAAFPGVALHSLCTRTEARPEELSRTFQVSWTFTDYHEMLADPDLGWTMYRFVGGATGVLENV